MSAADVCRELGWPAQSKLTRLERRETSRISPAELRELLDLYGVSGPARMREREQLLACARQARSRGWWQPYKEMIDPVYSTYIGLETEAATLLWWELAVIPGLFQTADYAESLLQYGGPYEMAAETIKQLVKVRAERQEALTREENPLRVWAIIHESALLSIVGDHDIMRKQLQHVLDLMKLPLVTVQVLPFNVRGGHPGTAGPFTILQFPEESDADAVYVEGLDGQRFVEEKKDVDRYHVAFQRLTALAMGPADTLNFITKAAKALP